MQQPGFLLMLHLLLAPVFLFAQHGSKHPADPAQQRAWLRSAADSLAKVTPAQWPILQARVLEHPEGKKVDYRLMGKGCLTLPNGHFICFLSTSSDAHPAIGDVTLARDDRGAMALYRGHVCGGIIHFIGSSKATVRKLSDFTRFFRSNTDTLNWEVHTP